MPLIAQDNHDTVRIEIAPEIDPDNAGDWYELKTRLNWFDVMTLDEQQAFTYSVGRAADGSTKGQPVTISPDRAVHLNLLKLSTFLVKWSHQHPNGKSMVPIRSETIMQIPPRSGNHLLKRIDELLEAQRGPVNENDPLPLSSNGSSSGPSAEPTPADA